MTISDEPGPASPSPAPRDTGRERVGRAAYELFSKDGIRAVGVDAIIAHAGTAKMTLYRNFPSKNDLIIDFLQRRERVWTREWLEAESRHRGDTPRQQLLAIFDVFGEWFARPDFEGCSFLTTMLEVSDGEDPIRQAAVRHRDPSAKLTLTWDRPVAEVLHGHPLLASAATGGGCSSVGSLHYGSGNVCIGASSPGVARPDAYISLNSHPACTIWIRAERSDGKAASSWHGTPCPSGTTFHWRVFGLAFTANYTSHWRNHTEIDFSNGVVATAYSPWLQLP